MGQPEYSVSAAKMHGMAEKYLTIDQLRGFKSLSARASHDIPPGRTNGLSNELRWQ